METGKTSKYLKYAIGEIILVVIGILIALQINNWNEKNKSLNQAKTYIKDIKKELVNDTIMFAEAIKRVKKTIRDNKSVLNTSDFSNIKSDSLLQMLKLFHSTRIYQINNATYQKLVSTGFMQTDTFSSLFSKINDYYTKEYIAYTEYIEWDEEQSIDVFHSDFLDTRLNEINLASLYQEHANSLENLDELHNDIRQFIASNRFKNKLLANYTRKELVVERIKIQKQLATDLIITITNKLSK